MFSSKYHVELNPSELGIYDKIIMQEIIKDLAQTPLITFSPVKFKIVILLEGEFLSKDAQNALRRTLEKFHANIRIILLTNSLERITCAMKSRFLKLRTTEISNCEITFHSPTQTFFNSDINVKNVSKEIYFNLKMALSKNELNYIKVNRQLMYHVIDRCVSPSTLIYNIVEEAFEDTTLSMDLYPKIVDLASKYENRICLGSKAIYHIEAFLSSIYLLFSNR